MDNIAIKNWAEDDRPREKLLAKGIDSLSHSELLAILINNGTKDSSAVAVAKNLLSKVGNSLDRLGRMSVKEILQLKVKGIGPAKAVSIVASFELGIRRESSNVKKESFSSSNDVAAFLKAKLQYKMQEVFAVIYLNQANKILHYEVVSEGGITGTVADPRIILKKALEHNAVNIIVSHNHPSGNLSPSKADKELTQKLKQAALLLELKVIDHIIISNEGYFSFADEGLL
jgi:DNA repair protein RadC